MDRIPVILVFDIGKTNKKCLVFDANYEVVHAEFFDVPDAKDPAGFPTEDLDALQSALEARLRATLRHPAWELRALNFTTYGATIVNTDAAGRPVHPLWDYLRPYDAAVLQSFDRDHGHHGDVYVQTASPALGNLNTGLQLFLLKKTEATAFAQIARSTWLPQYLSALFTGELHSEYTSIGCHTLCWDFSAGDFAGWTTEEGIDRLFPPLRSATDPLPTSFEGHSLMVGIGMHDSSSALLPYLRSIDKPFMLLSTGSWNICLNPFNEAPLTPAELAADCLCYLTYTGRPVKASRLHAGFRHTEAVEALCRQFDTSKEFFWNLTWDPAAQDAHTGAADEMADAAHAYYSFLRKLVDEQLEKIGLVASDHVRLLYVDGGFSHNAIFMGLLRRGLPGWTIAAAEVGQSTALGAAMVLHEHWNPTPLRKDLVRFHDR